MFRSIWEDLTRQFSKGNRLTQIIIINCMIWVVLNLLKIVLMQPGKGVKPVFNDILYFFCFSKDWWHNLTHPWVFVTAGFVHEDLSHILWNMLGLYWFGSIVGDMLGNRRILPLYLLGTLVGLITFYLIHLLPAYATGKTYAMGASAAMMAMTTAAATTAPNYSMHLLFIGPVRLKYIALVVIFLNLIAIAENANTGGSVAHLGGALLGWWYVTRLRSGRDLGSILYRIRNLWMRLKQAKEEFEVKNMSGQTSPPRPQPKSRKQSNSNTPPKSNDEQRLNEILEKIKRFGYDSLSPDEKDFLFRASGN
jgi:membrane associated rhomboid family serine protease